MKLSISSRIKVIVVFSLAPVLFGSTAHAAIHTFPVIGPSSFSNDFTASRSNGQHNAIDIIADKRRPIVSATDGTIAFVAYPEPSYGFMIRIISTGGYTYDYIHLNNDTPGTDDGRGDPMFAYAAGVREGNPVKKGQLLGWVGDSGNAENTVPHLHYEVRDRSERPYNPYNELKVADRISTPSQRAVPPNEAIPYGEKNIALNVALADLDNDGSVETIVGSGRRERPRIMIYDTGKRLLTTRDVYNTRYLEGIDVAAGDVDNDGVKEVIASARTAEGSRLWVYDFTGDSGLNEIAEFTGVTGVTSGCRVAAGDVNNDGVDEIIIGSGLGQGAKIEAVSINGQKIAEYSAGYENAYSGGVDVASGDVINGPGDEVIVSRLGVGSPTVKVLSGLEGKALITYNAHGNSHQKGVRVAVGNVYTSSVKAEIVTLPNGGNPKLKTFSIGGSPLKATTLRETYFLERWWRGYYDVGASENTYRSVTGYNRRASVHW